MQLKELHVWRTCRRPKLFGTAATIGAVHVQHATARRPGVGPCAVHSTIWATHRLRVHAICTSSTPSTSVATAIATLTLPWTIWPRPKAFIPTVWSRPWSDWSWRITFPTGQPLGTAGVTTVSLSLSPRFKTGSKQREKKAKVRITGDYLDTVLSNFSGYIAADELYDGPFCILSIVDNRTFQRLIYEVLDHNPTHDDMLAFFRRFKAALDSRGLTLQGITTDGSPLYPVPIAAVLGCVPHQICEFHVIKDITKAILHAIAKVRKSLKQRIPPQPRGRPSKAQRRTAALAKRMQRRIAELFENRYLFVQHHLTPAEEKTLRRVSRGLPILRSLRLIMDEVYRLFDRRCRMDTALKKLASLRRRVRRFKQVDRSLNKLFSPTLEKALIFLDDKLLASTSNAVERGNRRYRKMQKSVYRVRTQEHICHRIALDMLRDLRSTSRLQTTTVLHLARAG